jgi:hypothetical protein
VAAIAERDAHRGTRRLGYAALAAALLAVVVILVVTAEASWWQAVAFGLGPDAPLLYGIAPGLARGQLHPRAVPLYNALHRFWGPLVLLVVAFAAGLPRGCVVGALAWTLHIALDRAIGFRLRSADGFQRPDGTGGSRLQVLGRAAWRHRRRRVP